MTVSSQAQTVPPPSLHHYQQKQQQQQPPTAVPEPPQEVIMAWVRAILKEEYARTGQWPLPAAESYYQPPLAGLAAPAPALLGQEMLHHSHRRSARRTGFSYRGSEYWAAAGKLIEEQAPRPVAVELRFGCQLVLSLILAWMHFPLFNGLSGRSGEWMTLGCDRMCKELRVTSRNVLSYLYELERCGVVLPGRLDTGIISRLEFDTLKADIPQLEVAASGGDYWQARCVQQKSTFYRLKPGIARPSLPQFDPFQPQPKAEKDVGRTWEGPEKGVQARFDLETGGKKTSTTSFPGLHDHESEYEHDMKANKKLEEKDLKEEMPPGQLEKYNFLKSIHESFPGSLCGEMSDQAATRLSSQYEMPQLKAALSKVGRDWARNGQRIENPVALFISVIPKHFDRPAHNSGGGRNKSGPLDLEKYTTGKYAFLTKPNIKP